MHKCAVMLGLKLRHHHMLRLYCLHSRLLKEGAYAAPWTAPADQLSNILRSHVTYKDYKNFSKLRQLLLGCTYLSKQNDSYGWVLTYL